MTKPRFSVIIPTLNEEKFLPNLLASLAQQSLKDFEVIVVDGSSKDNTVALARSFEKKLPGFRVIVSKKASLPLQRNLGAKESRGDWFIFVDADSVLLSNFFERLEQFIEKENPKLLTTWFRPDSEVSGDAMITLLGNMMIEGSILFHRPLAPGPLIVVHRDAFGAVGGFNEQLSFGEDQDFSARLYERGVSLQILRETLSVYSLRRIRMEGKLRMIQTYAKAIFSVLLTKRAPKSMPGYIMGGQLYGKSKKSNSRFANYEKKLKKMMRELFE